MQKIHPMLWFNDQAQEAAELYTSIFPNSKIRGITKYGPPGPLPAGYPPASHPFRTSASKPSTGIGRLKK